MTGIALGLNEIKKIALGNTEVARVSLGTVDVWPPPSALGFTPMTDALVRSQSGSANNLTARIDFNTNGSVVPGVAGGVMGTSGIRDWWTTPPPALPPILWVRVRNIAQNGGTLGLFGFNLSAIGVNTWVDFNQALGFQCNLSSSGSNAYNRWVDLAVDFSTTPGGGEVDATSTFRLNVIKT